MIKRIAKVWFIIIREFTDNAGYVHTNVEKAKPNETLHIVEAKDKTEALNKFKEANND